MHQKTSHISIITQTNPSIAITPTKSNLRQSPRLPPNLIPKIQRIRRIPTRHQRQLPRPITNQHIRKLISGEDLLRLRTGFAIADAEFLGVDGL